MPMNDNYWFPAKRYGYGWGLPVRWQGWLVILAWLAIILTCGLTLMPQRPGAFLLRVTIATAVLVFVCYLKGEPARWRWGEDRKDGDGRRR